MSSYVRLVGPRTIANRHIADWLSNPPLMQDPPVVELDRGPYRVTVELHGKNEMLLSYDLNEPYSYTTIIEHEE